MTDDVHKLLAGYATNTLTESERRELFDASLHDAELFAALADEQALRDLLDDPAARTELLARIDPAPVAFRDRFAAWLRRPATVAVLGTAAVAITAIAILPLLRHTPQAASEREMAEVMPPSPPRGEIPAPQDATRLKQDAEQSMQVRKSVKPRLQPPKQLPENPVLQPRLNALPQPPASPPAAAPEVNAERAMKAMELKQADAATLAPSDESAAKKGPAKEDAAPIRYAILRRSPNGDYIQVPSSTEFAPGDTVRVRVETLGPAVVTISEPAVGRMVFSQHSTGVAETGDILLTADHTLEITQTPLPAASAAPGGVVGGVVGGFPSAMMRDKAAQNAAPAMAVRRVSQTPSVTILLRVKKP